MKIHVGENVGKNYEIHKGVIKDLLLTPVIGNVSVINNVIYENT